MLSNQIEMRTHIDYINTTYIRPSKAECFFSEWSNYEDRSGNIEINTLYDISVQAMGQMPGVTPRQGRFIDDCDFYIDCTTACPVIRHIEGRVLYGGYMRKSWGHFLMNSTARLWPIFRNTAVIFDKIIFFAEDDTFKSVNDLHPNIKEFLSIIGIVDKVEILPQSTYFFEKFIIGDISFEIGKYYSDEFLLPFKFARETVLSNIINNPCRSRNKGIILLRSNWNNNKDIQINLREVESLFISAGYLPLSPEGLTLKELICLMNDSDKIVSFAGSTAHNILFCENKNLIILERCAANNLYQEGILKLMKNPTVLVDCFFQPLLVSSTDNLTIYGATDEMKRFAEDYGIRIPDFRLTSRQEFLRYFKVYRRHYGHGPGINEWEYSQASAIFEAYFASRRRYGRYIDRRSPLMWSDFLSPRVIYRFLKDFLSSGRFK